MTPRSKTPGYSRQYIKHYRAGHRQSVDATVCRRMIQALRCIGYTSNEIAEGSNLADRHVVRKIASDGRPRKLVYLSTHRGVEEFYRTHHMHPREGAPAKRSITYAKKAGWSPPLAWDDITDPTERPKS